MARNSDVLPWKARWKVVVGAARGLRYLHEESRVRCIVQPNTIGTQESVDTMTLTLFSCGEHRLVGFQPVGLGMSCVLVPEYAETGNVTDKADVYSFGVMLLELVSGQKALDPTRARGPISLMEWARPLIQAGNTKELVDPRLKNVYDVHQLNKVVDAAGRCINKDLGQLPTMSEVLQILERKPPVQAIIFRSVRVQYASPMMRKSRCRLSYCDML